MEFFRGADALVVGPSNVTHCLCSRTRWVKPAGIGNGGARIVSRWRNMSNASLTAFAQERAGNGLGELWGIYEAGSVGTSI